MERKAKIFEVILDAGKLSDPSWLMFFLATGIGTVGLMVLLIGYFFGND